VSECGQVNENQTKKMEEKLATGGIPELTPEVAAATLTNISDLERKDESEETPAPARPVK
jgi:hypothetical protein